MRTPAARVRVLLVDDHAVVRAGYRLLLHGAPEIEVIGEADSGELAYRYFAERAPDVVVMDLSLPGIGGLEAIRRIVQRDADARILVFSMHEDTMFVEHALAAGARGYVTKSSRPQALVTAVKEVAAGRRHVDADIEKRLAFERIRGRDTPLVGLSTREFEIFCLLAEGLSSTEIGKRLSLSTKTVANYGSQIKTKLDVSTLAELARLAIRHGVIAA
jgi:DNA-binding NarL/FixJ family response regulator